MGETQLEVLPLQVVSSEPDSVLGVGAGEQVLGELRGSLYLKVGAVLRDRKSVWLAVRERNKDVPWRTFPSPSGREWCLQSSSPPGNLSDIRCNSEGRRPPRWGGATNVTWSEGRIINKTFSWQDCRARVTTQSWGKYGIYMKLIFCHSQLEGPWQRHTLDPGAVRLFMFISIWGPSL